MNYHVIVMDTQKNFQPDEGQEIRIPQAIIDHDGAEIALAMHMIAKLNIFPSIAMEHGPSGAFVFFSDRYIVFVFPTGGE